AVLVVAGVLYELHVAGDEGAAPDVKVVVGLDDVLARVIEVAARALQARRRAEAAGDGVAEEEAVAAEAQVLAVHVGEPVGDEGKPDPVDGAAPPQPGEVGAEFEGVADLGEGERLVTAVVPAAAGEDAGDAKELLDEVEPEAELAGPGAARQRDVGLGDSAALEHVDRRLVVAHVGEVLVVERAQRAEPVQTTQVLELDFEL